MNQQLEEHLSSEFLRQFPLEFAQSLEDLSLEEQRGVLSSLSPAKGASALAAMGPSAAADLVEALDGDVRKAILPKMDVGRLSLIYARVDPKDRQAIGADLPEALASELNELVRYPSDRAGFYMDPRPLHFLVTDTVEQALTRIRKGAKARVTDLPVVDERGVLQAKISLLDAALANGAQTLIGLKRGEPVTVQAMSSKDEVLELMEAHSLSSLPVVGGDDKLLGIIRGDGLMSIVQQDAAGDIQTMVGVSAEERALSPISFAIKKRLPWLSINLLTTFVAAFVVGMFEDTIAKVTALAVLLPIVAGQSGNTGMQAQAVTMRGLALREIRPRHWWQMVTKEGSVGLLNGVAIGLACGFAVFLWSGSPGLGAVMGVSMILAMLIAGLSGAAIPLVLSVLKQDPAQSSSIILTTVTDVVGFLSFLGLATLFIQFLI